MIKKDILSTPKHGWCNFHLADEEKEFNAALSYLTDVMYDTLKMWQPLSRIYKNMAF